jgi:hypothetical protein
VGKPERKRHVGKFRCRCENNIKIVLTVIGWSGRGWIHLDQDRDKRRALVKAVINLCIPQNIGKLLSACITGSISSYLHELQDSERY